MLDSIYIYIYQPISRQTFNNNTFTQKHTHTHAHLYIFANFLSQKFFIYFLQKLLFNRIQHIFFFQFYFLSIAKYFFV